MGPGNTVMSAASASNPAGSTLTYQEQLAGLLRWKAGAASYDRLAQQRQADFDASRDPTIAEYLVIDGRTERKLSAADVANAISAAKIPLLSVSRPWAWRQTFNPSNYSAGWLGRLATVRHQRSLLSQL